MPLNGSLMPLCAHFMALLHHDVPVVEAKHVDVKCVYGQHLCKSSDFDYRIPASYADFDYRYTTPYPLIAVVRSSLYITLSRAHTVKSTYCDSL